MGKLNMTPEELAALHERQAKADAQTTPDNEIEMMAVSVYSQTHKGRQWKKWQQLDQETQDQYRAGVRNGFGLIAHRRSHG